jgi:hypothetical protein
VLADLAAGTVVSAIPASDALDSVVATVTRCGGRHVDASLDPGHLAGLTRRDAEVRDAGAVVVTGAGWMPGLGELLATRACDAVAGPAEVHVAYWVPGPRSVFASSGAEEHRERLQSLTWRSSARRDGAAVDEVVGEVRRLAWFPRPVGPHHAASIAGGEALLLARHVDVATVRTYLALRSWVAEGLQALGTIARTRRGSQWVTARARRAHTRPDRRQRTDERWAVVVELAALDGGIHRAWAYGRDRHAVTAEMLATVARDLDSGAGRPGVWSPAQFVGGPVLLDVLAATTGLRWSVARPG